MEIFKNTSINRPSSASSISQKGLAIAQASYFYPPAIVAATALYLSMTKVPAFVTN